MLCHIDIDTSGAHSLRTMPLSRDWKALIMNESRWVRIARLRVVSKVMESILRNKVENSLGLSVKRSMIR